MLFVKSGTGKGKMNRKSVADLLSGTLFPGILFWTLFVFVNIIAVRWELFLSLDDSVDFLHHWDVALSSLPGWHNTNVFLYAHVLYLFLSIRRGSTYKQVAVRCVGVVPIGEVVLPITFVPRILVRLVRIPRCKQRYEMPKAVTCPFCRAKNWEEYPVQWQENIKVVVWYSIVNPVAFIRYSGINMDFWHSELDVNTKYAAMTAAASVRADEGRHKFGDVLKSELVSRISPACGVKIETKDIFYSSVPDGPTKKWMDLKFKRDVDLQVLKITSPADAQLRAMKILKRKQSKRR